jgi:hypothetical protein
MRSGGKQRKPILPLWGRVRDEAALRAADASHRRRLARLLHGSAVAGEHRPFRVRGGRRSRGGAPRGGGVAFLEASPTLARAGHAGGLRPAGRASATCPEREQLRLLAARAGARRVDGPRARQARGARDQRLHDPPVRGADRRRRAAALSAHERLPCAQREPGERAGDGEAQAEVQLGRPKAARYSNSSPSGISTTAASAPVRRRASCTAVPSTASRSDGDMRSRSASRPAGTQRRRPAAAQRQRLLVVRAPRQRHPRPDWRRRVRGHPRAGRRRDGPPGGETARGEPEVRRSYRRHRARHLEPPGGRGGTSFPRRRGDVRAQGRGRSNGERRAELVVRTRR